MGMRHRTRPVPLLTPWPKRHRGYRLEGGDKKISKTGFGFKRRAEKFSEGLIPGSPESFGEPPFLLLTASTFGFRLRLDGLSLVPDCVARPRPRQPAPSRWPATRVRAAFA